MNRDDIKALVEIGRLVKALQAKPKPLQAKPKPPQGANEHRQRGGFTGGV